MKKPRNRLIRKPLTEMVKVPAKDAIWIPATSAYDKYDEERYILTKHYQSTSFDVKLKCRSCKYTFASPRLFEVRRAMRNHSFENPTHETFKLECKVKLNRRFSYCNPNWIVNSSWSKPVTEDEIDPKFRSGN